MAGYQAPDFIERSATARAARQIALDKLRHKEAPDPAVIAERQKALAVREALAVEWRAARQLAAAEPKAAKSAATTPDPEKSYAGRPPPPPAPTDAELKAVRDERYAARKARKR